MVNIFAVGTEKPASCDVWESTQDVACTSTGSGATRQKPSRSGKPAAARPAPCSAMRFYPRVDGLYRREL